MATQQKTPTPIIYVDKIIPGQNFVSGWVGTVDSSGVKTPEVGALVFIYINGFLINTANELPVLTDANGYWATEAFYIPNGYNNTLPSVLTVRAQGKYKEISDSSPSYMLRGSLTPIDLGVIDEYGNLRPPYEGESVLTGRLSYWGKKEDGLPFMNCANKIHIYSNNIKIGEVLKNKIIGLNAIYPITESLNGKYLKLMVDETLVTIPFEGLDTVNFFNLSEQITGVNTSFVFNLPAQNCWFKVYKNGLHQAENIDYTYTINVTTLRVVIALSSIPEPTDIISVVVYYNASEFVDQEEPTGDKNGINLVYVLGSTPRVDTVQFYMNGIELNEGGDYTISGDTITMAYAPQADDYLFADYQKDISVFPQLTYKITPTVTTPGDPTIPWYTFTPVNGNGFYAVYMNGQLQLPYSNSVESDNLSYDYTIEQIGSDYVIKFAYPIRLKLEPLVTVVFYQTGMSITDIVNYLNNRVEFTSNCLSASVQQTNVPTGSLVLEQVITKDNTFTLPTTDFPITIRIYKNRLRQYENVDYTIDYDNREIIFSAEITQNDMIIGVIQYQSADLTINEFPVGEKNGVNQLYSLVTIPDTTSLQVYKNGYRMNPFTSQYVIIDNKILFDTPLQPKDNVVIDYQPYYRQDKLVYTSTFIESPDGARKTFTFNPPVSSGYTYSIFVNGMRLRENIDFTLLNNIVTFNASMSASTVLFIEFYISSYDIYGGNSQLVISSYNTLDIDKSGIDDIRLSVYNTLFGTGYKLSPGKDSNGKFKFFFRHKTSDWKFTYQDNLGNLLTFKRGEHLSARHHNEADITYV